MLNKPFDLPDQRGFDLAYQEAYQLASRNLAETADLEALCHRSGVSLIETAGHKAVVLNYLGQTYHVHLPEVEITATGGEPLTPRDRLIILHYLNTAKGSPLTGRFITFKELPDGAVYYPTFVKRTLKPLLDNFAQAPRRLLPAAQKLGGQEAALGDISIRLNALPRVPLTLVLWLGDAEVAPEGNILYDSSITDYLPTEDITVLCEIISWKLVKLAGEGITGT